MTDPVRSPRSPLSLRLILVIVLVGLLGLPVVAAMAASPDPSAPTQPAASSAPAKSPGSGGDKDRGGSNGGFGRGDITVTAVSGSKVSLTTEDGWTRTITVTADTTITKGGQAITVADLEVGDEIGFRQKKNDDSSYTVTAITVRTPKAGGEVTATSATTITVASRKGATTVITVNGSTIYQFGKDAGTKADVTVGSRVNADGTISGTTFTATRVRIEPALAGGEVTAKTGSTITVKGRGDKTTVIHVDAGTTYKVRGKDAGTLADIAVGDWVLATGKVRADGSLDATQVGAGKFKTRGGPAKSPAPGASATP